MAGNIKVLFLLPYPLHRAPSQRFRVEAYFDLLAQNGIDYTVDSFLDDKAWEVLYKKGSGLQKAMAVISGFWKRLVLILSKASKYDYVFVHREASPIGPPVFEFITAKVLKRKLIYDFDDAIWIPNTTAENKIVNWVKAFWKVKYICKWSYKVAGGNNFLCSYARRYTNSVFLLPTCVDVVNKHNRLKDQEGDKIRIGWTGSHSTMIYLDEIVPMLKQVIDEFGVELIIISNRAPTFTLPNMKYIPWKERSEIEDLSLLNIGLMPLPDDVWSEGKCGFKLIQYMALGMPVVASPVGVNKEIVEEKTNGFLCTSSAEWYAALKELISNANLRSSMGSKGRDKIVHNYSVQANAGSFLALFS
ncbi:MAG TPA: glycosyltransferase [Chitinophagaceae bacterium]|nr:glycosyltransferase [Chitinophagaceae bacterium]